MKAAIIGVGNVGSSLAAAFPGLALVKGFNHFGAEIMAAPTLLSGPADAYFAGDLRFPDGEGKGMES